MRKLSFISLTIKSKKRNLMKTQTNFKKIMKFVKEQILLFTSQSHFKEIVAYKIDRWQIGNEKTGKGGKTHGEEIQVNGLRTPNQNSWLRHL